MELMTNDRSQVVTYMAPCGARVDLCMECSEKLLFMGAGVNDGWAWPVCKHCGEKYAHVYKARHAGECSRCRTDREETAS